MNPVHMFFDLSAVVLAMVGGGLVYWWRFRGALEKTVTRIGGGYFLALSGGSVLGSYLLGTGNLYLSGEEIVGRSILGALCGAIVTVELYKLFRGARGSTGYIYVVPFCLLVIVGRFGCYFSGMDDHTYGVETSFPWAVDYGDGVLRHPVQLYESLSMAGFLVAVLGLLAVKPQVIVRYGFYLCVGFYAGQRFVWEFFKPYGAVIGGLNLFHIVCLVMVAYSVMMILRERNDSRCA
ncbi:MAG: prolipoprotein diacylglyceryl transferase [Alphaproteobacteria bacterium]|nr:prolipoprotein diacylglyceryl transferase [Alphaproteobacteria bacterium]